MTGWATYQLSEVGRVVTGRTPPSSEPDQFIGDVPFLTPSDMDYRRRRVVPERQVAATWDCRNERISLPPRAVCVVCIGATIGKMCMTQERSQSNQQINSIIVDETRFDPSFIYYALSLMADDFKAKAAGAATPILNKGAFSSVTLSAPSLDTQRRIAGILSAYDDLIENNERRIAILEEMARRVFREWFVDFRFLGHEAVRMVDTEAGRIPEGWRRVTLGEVADLVGRSVSPSATPEDIFAHYSLPAFDTGRRPTLEPGATIQSNKLAFQLPAVLVAKLNPRFDRTWLVEEGQPHPHVCSTEYLPLKPRAPVSAAVLHCMVSSKEFRDRVLGLAQGTSTSHQRAKPGDILQIPVVVPTTDLLGEADSHLSPLLRGAERLRRSSFALKKSRDLLLPRLISGELDVTTAERLLEAAE